MNENNLIRWAIDRKHTEAHIKNVIMHMRLKYGEANVENMLPPIFFKDINELSNDEVRLLDNFTYMFFKGEECAFSL